MPIPGIEQPNILKVDVSLRLRRYDGGSEPALRWYQDVETVWLVDGDRTPYTPDVLMRMYDYLDAHGELYWIETLENGVWRPIGDVAFWQNDMPIVIGEKAYRGRGVGGKVIAALTERARGLGYPWLEVAEIYDWNDASRSCFERAGFAACAKTEKGRRCRLELAARLLETPRLLVRRFARRDAEVLFSILSDERVMRYLEPPFSYEQTEAFIEQAGLCDPPLVYAAAWKETGAVIGHAIFHPYDENSYELGWVLSPVFWGMGLASELTAALIAEAKTRGAASAVLECAPAQAATRRIAEKLGFAPPVEANGLMVFRRSL